MSLPERAIYRFADVEVDAARSCLKRKGQEHHLRQQNFQVLLYLLEQRERQVSKDELIQHIWKGAAVTDNSIVQCIAKIREAIGDNPRNPRFIKTVPKVGYRFIGPIEETALDTVASVATEESTTFRLEVKPSIKHRILLAAAFTALLLAGTSVYLYTRRERTRAGSPPEVALAQVPGKRALAVMYFENQSGHADLDWLREGLTDMLITNLSRAKNLTVLGRQQLQSLLERMEYKSGEKTQMKTAQEVARRSRAELIVMGRFVRFGERLRIEVELYDTRSTQPLLAEGLNADRLEQIPLQIDLLSIKLAKHLGTPSDEQELAPGLSQTMTDNLEAYRYYSLALEKAQAFHSTEALALLKRAVALDPQFALAYARIGYIHVMIRNGEGERAKRYLEKAFQLSPRLNEKDRLYVMAWYAQANLDQEGAIKAFRQLISQYPLETDAYWQLGFQLGQAGRFEEAADAYRQGLAIDPEAKDIYNKLGFIYSRMGRYDEAIVAHRSYVALAPNEPNAYDSLGITLTEAGRYAEALAELARARALDPKFHFASLHTADVYFRLGRYREAQSEYERFLLLAPSDWDRGIGYNRLVLLHLQRGEIHKAEANARLEFKHQKDLGGPLMVALARNDLDAAARWKARFFENKTHAWPNTAYGSQVRAYLLGTYELKRGRTREALELLRQAAHHPFHLWTVGTVIDCLANAYLELGCFDDAVAEYKRLLALNPNYPPARYHLAQVYERRGQQDRARTEYAHFLQLWKDADLDIPEIVRAKTFLST